MGVEPGTFGTETDNTWCTEWNSKEAKNTSGSGTHLVNTTCKTWPKQQFAYLAQQGSHEEYFQLGIVPILIFIIALAAIGWGLLCGILIRRVDMTDKEGHIDKCIEEHGLKDEIADATGEERQKDSTYVKNMFSAVGDRITIVSIFYLFIQIFNTAF